MTFPFALTQMPKWPQRKDIWMIELTTKYQVSLCSCQLPLIYIPLPSFKLFVWWSKKTVNVAFGLYVIKKTTMCRLLWRIRPVAIIDVDQF